MAKAKTPTKKTDKPLSKKKATSSKKTTNAKKTPESKKQDTGSSQPSRRKWAILIDNKYPSFQINRSEITKLCKNVLKNFDVPSEYPLVEEVSLVFADDHSVQELNSYYRGKNKPTDVLSFSMLEGDASELSRSLGDVVISLDTAKAQAKKNKQSISDEVATLIIHGLLHLLGYDHENTPKNEAKMMFLIQDELFRRFAGKELIKS
jgi:probable rRNA maturation factor